MEEMTEKKAEDYYDFLNCAMDKRMTGDTKEEEGYLNMALEHAVRREEKWFALCSLCTHYMQFHMYLKAEKTAKQIINEFPDNYEGYHLFVQIQMQRKSYDEAVVYIEQIPDEMKNHPQYFADLIGWLEQSGRYEELLELLKKDEKMNQVIPEYVLRKRISVSGTLERTEEAMKDLLEMLSKFGDIDAAICLAYYLFANGNYRLSADLANIIMDEEKDTAGIRFYLALLCEMYSFYYLAKKKPSEQLLLWMQKACIWCSDFVAIHYPEMLDKVLEEIEALFENIDEEDK